MTTFNIGMGDSFYRWLIVQQTQEKGSCCGVHLEGSFRSSGLLGRNRTTETNYKNNR